MVIRYGLGPWSSRFGFHRLLVLRKPPSEVVLSQALCRPGCTRSSEPLKMRPQFERDADCERSGTMRAVAAGHGTHPQRIDVGRSGQRQRRARAEIEIA